MKGSLHTEELLGAVVPHDSGLRTEYRIDAFQKNYFVIESFEDLVRRTTVDFGGLYQELAGTAPIKVGTRLPTDVLFAPNPASGLARNRLTA